jgi:hypothetical protein
MKEERVKRLVAEAQKAQRKQKLKRFSLRPLRLSIEDFASNLMHKNH